MRGAWCEYDVAMHLATRYKVISKLLFFASLVVAWAMVLVGVAKVLPPPPYAALRCLPVSLLWWRQPSLHQTRAELSAFCLLGKLLTPDAARCHGCSDDDLTRSHPFLASPRS